MVMILVLTENVALLKMNGVTVLTVNVAPLKMNGVIMDTVTTDPWTSGSLSITGGARMLNLSRRTFFSILSQTISEIMDPMTIKYRTMTAPTMDQTA